MLRALDLRAAATSLTGAAGCVACGASGARLCARCSEEIVVATPIDLPGSACALAAAAYEGVPRSLVLALKKGGDRDAARCVARLLHVAAMRARLRPDALTWVPGRAEDIRRRGFDHGALIARRLADVWGVPSSRLLSRLAPRPHQAGSTRTERRLNATGAFTAQAGRGRILLVDDVLTTGATATECVAALRAAGTKAIDVLVACRA